MRWVRFLVLGAIAAAIPALVPPQSYSQLREPSSAIPEGQIFPKETYILEVMGNAVAENGTMLDVKVYRSSDGTKVVVEHGDFRSLTASAAELRRVAATATRVVEQGPKRGRFGGVAGQRARLFFAAERNQPAVTEVIWTQGSQLYSISSVSSNLVVDMERRYY